MLSRHKNNLLFLLFLNLLFAFNYLKLCDAKRKHESIDTNDVTDANKLDVQDIDENNSFEIECHRAAVWKCGHVFIRAHKFLNYIGTKDSFEAKCALRTAFFMCLKVSKTKYCHKQHKSPHTKRFRKRLADTLWSTRACVLGIKN